MSHDVDTIEVANEVRLVGKFPVPAQERELPSGDLLCSFRVTVERVGAATGGHVSRQRTDSLECVAWNGRVRRSVMRWQPGDLVEVSGALRRRFFTTPAGTGSRVEVEVSSGRRLRRADS